MTEQQDANTEGEQSQGIGTMARQMMLVNHGLSQQSFKEEYKPWK